MHLNCFEKSNWWFNWNKIAYKITSDLKTSPHNDLETNQEEMLRKKDISPELKLKLIDDLRLN